MLGSLAIPVNRKKVSTSGANWVVIYLTLLYGMLEALPN